MSSVLFEFSVAAMRASTTKSEQISSNSPSMRRSEAIAVRASGNAAVIIVCSLRWSKFGGFLSRIHLPIDPFYVQLHRFMTHATVAYENKRNKINYLAKLELISDLENHEVSNDEISAALARLGAWDGLARSVRLGGLLEYLIAETLAGRGATIKAKTIGMDVYGYTVDELMERESVVRVDVGRLRRKLEEYYGDTGKEDTVRISLPKGNYAPVFEKRKPAASGTNLDVGKPRPRNVSRWIAGSILAFFLITGFSVLQTRSIDGDSGSSTAQSTLERAAIFEASPNRLRAINLAGVGRDLIFPALGPGQLEAAGVTFEEATKVDSTYFGGYAGIAQVQATAALLSPTAELSSQALERANASATTALQLAPKEAWSQSAMAWVNFANGDFEQAARQSERAVGLKPNDPHIMEFDALISLYSGNFDRVVAESKRIETLLNGEPGYVFRNATGSAQYHLGNYVGTIEAFEKAIGAGAPIGPPTVAYLIAANQRLGRHSPAEKLAEQYAESWPRARIDLVLRKLFRDPRYAEDVISAMHEAGWAPHQ